MTNVFLIFGQNGKKSVYLQSKRNVVMSKWIDKLDTNIKILVDNINKVPKIVENIGILVAKSGFDYDFMKAIICGLKEEWLMDKAIQLIIDTWDEYDSRNDDRCKQYIGTYLDYVYDESGFYEVKKPLSVFPKYFDIRKTLENIKADELKRRKVNDMFEKMTASSVSKEIENNKQGEKPELLPNEPRKKGRKKSVFEDYLMTDAPKCLMTVLEDMMEGKSGREAYAIILAIKNIYIYEPTNKSVCERFKTVTETPYGEAIARHNGTSYGRKDFSNKKNPITEEELDEIRNNIKTKIDAMEKASGKQD